MQGGLLFAQAVDDYRSAVSGTWSTRANWQRWDGSAWVTPTAGQGAPDNTKGVVTILSAHTMTVSAAVSIDQVTINSGGTVQTSGSIILTIANGTGVDLQVDGTFIDGSSSSVVFSGTPTGAKWAFGATGTLVKTSVSCSNCWQTDYNGGASTMPSTANWILRKTGTSNPYITTIGAYYPNLTIENNYTSAWTTATTSTFTGSSGFPTIKGNFDIGGTGTNTVDFLNDNTNATAALVQGNMTVRTGSTLRNYGTGFNIQGDFAVNGTVNYAAGTGTRTITFSGGIAQSISGAGTLNIRNLTMSKSANSLTLNRAITIDNVLTMTTGIINSSSPTNFPTINTNGSVAGANNTSFVNGPIRYVGTAAFTFPIGKGSDYQPLGYGATVGGGTFWTEAFENSCAAGCYANGSNTGNGAWSVIATGFNDFDANNWYVSNAEGGQAAGVCGTGCNTDESLHLGADSWLVGDIGAAYDAGGCVFTCTSTDRRAESPTINCTGQSGITLAFNYIENGSGATDNATLWYYNGASWSQLFDLVKTSTCSDACSGAGQGLWAAYSITLPASADNNANVKIGFRWVNNDDGVGTDPSFAVDDITLSSVPPTVDFTCEYFYADPTTTFNNVMGAGLDHIDNCEYWVLTRNAGAASKSVTLTWDGNTCLLPSTPADYRVARWDGAVWQDAGNTITTGTAPPSAGTITSGTVTNFSPFTHGSFISVPIELLSFIAKYNGKNVDIDWITASEANNDYFTIEKTADGKIFQEVARVKGAGNSSTTLNYSSKDNDPLAGTSYYRLKQTDFDGKYEYSNLAAVTIDKKNILEIISINEDENGLLNVVLNCICQSELSVEIIDVTGKTVFSAKKSPSPIPYTLYPIPYTSVTANVSAFSNGLYLLKVSDGSTIEWKKFVL